MPLPAILAAVLACPRCRGALEPRPAALVCRRCEVEFPVTDGIPRLGDGAAARDARIAAELEAQHHARTLYLDPRTVMNHWEALALPRLVEELVVAGGPVLDLGCGVGKLGAAWVRVGRGSAALVGVDLQVELLEAIGDGYAALLEGDAHRLPLRDASFAAVAVLNALHHVADPVAVLHEVHRVLRPGGVVLAWDPRALASLDLLKRLLRRRHPAFGAHHRAFALGEYGDLFSAADLELVRVVAADPVGPLVATGLDLLHVGALGVGAPVARLCVALDEAIACRDRRGRVGLMLVARARRAGAEPPIVP